MLKIQKIIVGISGGVDSAVATLLLKTKGYNVEGLFMQNWDLVDETGICKSDEDFKDASFVCDKLGIPLYRVNFVKQYWNNVFSDLLIEYQSGGTPNPDVLCNRFIKFNYFYRYAREYMNADAIATGHYARTSFGPFLEHYEKDKYVELHKGKDPRKDQTLFLCQVNQEALQRCMFPIGGLKKSEVKEIASKSGLEQIAKKKESMGICFIGLRNFQEFISEYIADTPGNFVNIDTGKTVGNHNGIHQWTLGQRTKIKGLPIAYFTAKKDRISNTIYVAEGTNHPALFTKLLYTTSPHWIHSQPEELKNGDVLECDFKFQHVEDFIRCLVYKCSKGLIVSLETQRRSITPGQFAVFYKGDQCLGSAKIVHAGPSQFTLQWLQQFNINQNVDNKLGNTRNKVQSNNNDNNNLEIENEEIPTHFELEELKKQIIL